MQKYQMFMDGQFTDSHSGQFFDSWDPFRGEGKSVV